MSTTKHLATITLVLFVVVLASAVTEAEDGTPRQFESAEAAAEALVKAAQAHDVDALVALVGQEQSHLFRTGDDAADRTAREQFADAAGERIRLETGEDGRVTLHVGYADWAFPIPLVERDGGWTLDGAAGAEEALNRRIGANEIAAITFCEAVYMAQALYRAEDYDGDGVMEYARRLVSTPGRRDGLYWEPKPGQPASPLGRVLGVSGVAALGDGPGALWMGYGFRLLSSQGRGAPGGAHSYVVNGNMIAGFAVLATPHRYGDSGIATFMMGPNSVVLQRDYGRNTNACVCRVRAFAPDTGWTQVD